MSTKVPVLVDKDRFYISQVEYKDKIPKFLEVRGLPVDIPTEGYEDLDLFIHKTITSDPDDLDPDRQLTISEGKTGMAITNVGDLEEASSAVVDILNYHREIGNPEAISKATKQILKDKSSLSPRYKWK